VWLQVTVPPGHAPGHKIRVTAGPGFAPIKVTIPAGVKDGAEFQVQLPAVVRLAGASVPKGKPTNRP
jgi:hypothetical protein